MSESELHRTAEKDAKLRGDQVKSMFPNVDSNAIFDPRAEFLRRNKFSTSTMPIPRRVLTSHEAEVLVELELERIDGEIRSIGFTPGGHPHAEEARGELAAIAMGDLKSTYIVLPSAKDS